MRQSGTTISSVPGATYWRGAWSRVIPMRLWRARAETIANPFDVKLVCR